LFDCLYFLLPLRNAIITVMDFAGGQHGILE
jgi:hypothetical protein